MAPLLTGFSHSRAAAQHLPHLPSEATYVVPRLSPTPSGHDPHNRDSLYSRSLSWLPCLDKLLAMQFPERLRPESNGLASLFLCTDQVSEHFSSLAVQSTVCSTSTACQLGEPLRPPLGVNTAHFGHSHYARPSLVILIKEHALALPWSPFHAVKTYTRYSYVHFSARIAPLLPLAVLEFFPARNGDQLYTPISASMDFWQFNLNS